MKSKAFDRKMTYVKLMFQDENCEIVYYHTDQWSEETQLVWGLKVRDEVEDL